MSTVPFPEGKIWNNAAFDNGDSEDLASNRLKSIFRNSRESSDSDSGKENHGSFLENNISSVSRSIKSVNYTPFKPSNRDETLEKSKIKKGLGENDDKKIDDEIEKIECEINRLSSRLEALKLLKFEKSVKIVEKKGKVVPTKFMDQKQITKNIEDKKKIPKRGLSLGPREIASMTRRGMSMGPSDIFNLTKSRQLGKQEIITPVPNRRKSCFYNLQGIEEECKSLTASPKSRKIAAKTQVPLRQAVTTIASKKVAKKEGSVLNSVQPKKLFENSVSATNKKPVKPGRIVPSRYNQTAIRKRSLENDKDEGKRCEKKRSLSLEKSDVKSVESEENNNNKVVLGTAGRVKKRWEIPSEVLVIHSSNDEVENSPKIDLLPRIRIGRCVNESPRDSGAAKRVLELVGRKSYFCNDEEMKALTFDEEEGGEKS